MRDDPRYAVASPGVWLRECRWLGSQRPAVVGTDARIWGSANPAVTRGADGAAHQELFLRFGIRAWESVNLAEIVGAGVARFVYGHAPHAGREGCLLQHACIRDRERVVVPIAEG